MTDFWYAVRTAIGCEYRAKDEIQDELGLHVYCPTRRTHVVVRGKRSSRVRPLLPGYVFVHCDMNQIFMNAIRERDHVQDIIRKPESWEPYPISGHAMENLTFAEWRTEVDQRIDERWGQVLAEGNFVAFLSGLLEGEVFQVDRLDKRGQIRLTHSRDRTVRLTVQRTAVERVA